MTIFIIDNHNNLDDVDDNIDQLMYIDDEDDYDNNVT